MATEETRKYYDACPQHGLWHDLSQECFYCVSERAAHRDGAVLLDEELEDSKTKRTGHVETPEGSSL